LCHRASLGRVRPLALSAIRRSFEWIVVASVVVVFCFIVGGTTRDLLSFPTRRSSDLTTPSSAPSPSSPPEPWCSRARRSRPGPRSEEHTSELQSRFDLVCRLLLEKKNSSWG